MYATKVVYKKRTQLKRTINRVYVKTHGAKYSMNLIILRCYTNQLAYRLQNIWYNNKGPSCFIPRSPYPPAIPKPIQIHYIECLLAVLATMSRQALQFNHLTFSQWNKQHLHRIPQHCVAVAAFDLLQFSWDKQRSSHSLQSKLLIFPW